MRPGIRRRVLSRDPRSRALPRRAQHADRPARVPHRARRRPTAACSWSSRSQFRQMMRAKPDSSRTSIFRAFVNRRDLLRIGEGAAAIRIIGSRFSPEATALRVVRGPLAPAAHVDRPRRRPPTRPCCSPSVGARTEGRARRRDADRDVAPADTGRVRASPRHDVSRRRPARSSTSSSSAPVRPGWRRRSTARRKGSTRSRSTPSRSAARPARARASRTTSASRTGCPARRSTQTRRDPGHAARRAAQRAVRSRGASASSPGFHVIVLADGSEIPCRAVIVASGARYRRLAVDNLERFEGAGVYYAATDLEDAYLRRLRRARRGRRQLGRAGGDLPRAAAVPCVARRSGATRRRTRCRTTSIERIEADDRIDVAHRDRGARPRRRRAPRAKSTLEHTPSGERRHDRLPGPVLLHRRRARDRVARRLRRARPRRLRAHRPRRCPTTCSRACAYAARPPLPFETSCPGVFAVGDVRQGSMKRVAAAVGEGSSAVRSVHEYLATIT